MFSYWHFYVNQTVTRASSVFDFKCIFSNLAAKIVSSSTWQLIHTAILINYFEFHLSTLYGSIEISSQKYFFYIKFIWISNNSMWWNQFRWLNFDQILWKSIAKYVRGGGCILPLGVQNSVKVVFISVS